MCLFRALVLSSLALRMVAPLIAAFEAAMMVKSFPLSPSNTSLDAHQQLLLTVRQSFGENLHVDGLVG